MPLKHYHFITVSKSTLEKFPQKMKNFIEDNNFYENKILIKGDSFDELKYEEMSDILDTSVGALKASYHHARKKIEAILVNQ